MSIEISTVTYIKVIAETNTDLLTEFDLQEILNDLPPAIGTQKYILTDGVNHIDLGTNK